MSKRVNDVRPCDAGAVVGGGKVTASTGEVTIIPNSKLPPPHGPTQPKLRSHTRLGLEFQVTLPAVDYYSSIYSWYANTGTRSQIIVILPVFSGHFIFTYFETELK